MSRQNTTFLSEVGEMGVGETGVGEQGISLMDVLNVTEESSSCNSTPMDVLSARDRLRL